MVTLAETVILLSFSSLSSQTQTRMNEPAGGSSPSQSLSLEVLISARGWRADASTTVITLEAVDS